MTAVGQNIDAERWYYGMLNQIGQQLQLMDEFREFWLSNPLLSPLQRWTQAICEVLLPRYPGQVVIFIDEIDVVRSLPFSTDEFFAAIREFCNRRTEDEELERLTFCLLGVATPGDLIRDTRTTPFNIGQRIELHDFTESEAAPLAQGLKREHNIATALLRRIIYWTGGHPYLTQRLCQAVGEDADVQDAGGVDRICEELFFSTRAKERDENLLFVRERMLRSEVDLAGLLHLYEQVYRGKQVWDDEADILVNVLRLSGIVRVERGRLLSRNRIYARAFDREWIKTNMPGGELRRQREAFRRGLVRAAAVAAVIIAAMGALIWLALHQRNRAIEEGRANRRLLYVANVNLAQQAWEAANIGRMQELLAGQIPRAGEDDWRGFEWYYLWRLCHSELLTLPHARGLRGLALSPDGRRLATASYGRAARVWDVGSGRELDALTSCVAGASSVAFSPDGQILAAGQPDGSVTLCAALNGRVIATLTGHNRKVGSVAFSPDGARLASVHAVVSFVAQREPSHRAGCEPREGGAGLRQPATALTSARLRSET